MKTGRAWFCAALMASALFIPGLPLFGQSGDDPAAVAALGTARRMIAAGRYEEARKILDDAAKSPSAAVSSEARKQLSNLSLGEEWLMKLAGVLNATVRRLRAEDRGRGVPAGGGRQLGSQKTSDRARTLRKGRLFRRRPHKAPVPPFVHVVRRAGR
jgi:hypothetical protein